MARVELLSKRSIDPSLAGTGWTYLEGELIRVVRRDDFAAALEFVVAVGAIADPLGHHPDIDIRWNTVTLRLRTHSMGGVTDADLVLARALTPLC